MRMFEDIASQVDLMRVLRERLSVFYVFSNEILGDMLHVRAASFAGPNRLDPRDNPGRYAVPLDLTFCRETLSLGMSLAISETHTHPLVRNSPALGGCGAGVAAYLGVPVPGAKRTLCAMHVQRRPWSDGDIQMMREAARTSATLPYYPPED
ncbi:GAF domain-containing protein [Jannaschia seohaensis]|uniref:GAF domain-containing protein n=1 Tax=Jannaschia seohaensis TaxID=475081 RepID=A0A2Y9B1K5_9RHOB|nr:GAF domain-containing protein [Jannaschia seohaensis]PWJ15066.1 GAF domain-containing protein [Jannaschia seohaensis]SSA49915.1 GAF domain-containing protein [Jannaschia seohaensis]